MDGISTLWNQAIPLSGALHAWTTGAMGGMTLAVTTRATLGHPLTATKPTCVIYLAVFVASASRLAAGLLPGLTFELLSLAAFAWLMAFIGFAVYSGANFWGRQGNGGQCPEDAHGPAA